MTTEGPIGVRISKRCKAVKVLFLIMPVIIMPGLLTTSVEGGSYVLGGVGILRVRDNLADTGHASIVALRGDVVLRETPSVLFPLGFSFGFENETASSDTPTILSQRRSYLDFAIAYQIGHLTPIAGFIGGGTSLLLEGEERLSYHEGTLAEVDVDPGFGLLLTAGALVLLDNHWAILLSLRERLLQEEYAQGDILASANLGGLEVSITIGLLLGK